MKLNRDPLLLSIFEKCGSASALARKLGITRAAVSKWTRIPFKHLATVQRLTGFTRREMRPDLYGD
jgi:DNA-binding transcriptional regulator YdaS (Cro superfamily)